MGMRHQSVDLPVSIRMNPGGHIHGGDEVRVGEIVEGNTGRKLVDATENNVAVFELSETCFRCGPVFVNLHRERVCRRYGLRKSFQSLNLRLPNKPLGDTCRPVPILLSGDVFVPNPYLAKPHGCRREGDQTASPTSADDTNAEILQPSSSFTSPQSRGTIHDRWIGVIRPRRSGSFQHGNLRTYDAEGMGRLGCRTVCATPPDAAVNLSFAVQYKT